MEGCTELYWIDDDTHTAIRYRDEVLRAIVRPSTGAVVPVFLAWQENTDGSWRMKESIDCPPRLPDLNSIEHHV